MSWNPLKYILNEFKSVTSLCKQCVESYEDDVEKDCLTNDSVIWSNI